MVDGLIARRHRVVDFFFAANPLTPLARLERVFALARRYVVELETHPIQSDEYDFLNGGVMFECLEGVQLGGFPSWSQESL
jgi:hypothetical protein